MRIDQHHVDAQLALAHCPHKAFAHELFGPANEPGSSTSRVSAGVAQRAGSGSEAIGTETGRQMPQPASEMASEAGSQHRSHRSAVRERSTAITVRAMSATRRGTSRGTDQGGVSASQRGLRWAVPNTWSQTPLVTP